MHINPADPASFGDYSALAQIVTHQLDHTPKAALFFERRFAGAEKEELDICESFARQIILLAGNDLGAFFEGYNFICKIQKDEEIFFRRNNRYRLSSVQEAVDQVYSNEPYMQSYMRGLLMTQVFWSNHTSSMQFYLREFLDKNRQGVDLLEIGPGHGLLFSRAVEHPRTRTATAWDLSPASAAEAREALTRLGVSRNYDLAVRDLFDSRDVGPSFDAVVFSEVLEHLETPEAALDSIRNVMRPDARLYVNVPINSPAPDHVFLLRSPEEAVDFVKSRGFEIERTGFYPATNYSLEAARKHALTISVCIVAVKPS